ncbi:MAG: amino acid ABC transporter permease [Clostridia bacterium]|nr:amino acid ABC transporter permease [Clostridia bacterium]
MKNIEIFCRNFFEYGGYKDYLKGLSNTAIIAVFGLLIGFVLACVIAFVKLLPSKKIPTTIAKKVCDVYVAVFRGTPVVVQLLLMHFAIFPAIGVNISNVAEAVIIFGLNSAAYMSEMLRSGINAVDKGQMEAGRSLGLSYGTTMLRIILPHAIKNILPTLGNEFIALIKETSVVNFIAVVDVTKALTSIAESTYEYFVPYIVLALTYLIIVLFITWLIQIMERRLQRDER